VGRKKKKRGTGMKGHVDHSKSRGIVTLITETLAKIKHLLSDKTRSKKKTYIYEYRCDERLKAKAEGSTRLVYTGLSEGLEHLKIETRLINEMFESVM
jgi:hypothetical protein